MIGWIGLAGEPAHAFAAMIWIAPAISSAAGEPEDQKQNITTDQLARRAGRPAIHIFSRL
jgi:hypothetical protein